MNIRGLTPIPHATEASAQTVEKVAAASSQIKSETAHDRDANGQQFYQKQQKKKERMTQETFDKAIEVLRQKSFVKELNWIIESGEEHGIKYAYIKDSTGKTIRRIMEGDLWEVFDDGEQDRGRGNLLNKAA